MNKSRLEAFSDGVIAILITVMVLEFKVPQSSDASALAPLAPLFLSYVLSFVYLGIYWNNHHHLFQSSETVTGGVLWANHHLLFWLSLVPFATSWLAHGYASVAPVIGYGFVLMMAGVAYFILSRLLIRAHGASSRLARSIGRDLKGKLSVVLYAVGIGVAPFDRWIAIGFYVAVAIMWLVPDPRLETTDFKRPV